MSKENSPSLNFTDEIATINSTLVDNIDVSVPSYYGPVWPETDLSPVIADLNTRKNAVESRVVGQEALILKAQYRAIDYLYGKKEEAIDGKVPNPLVDVICLLSTLGDTKQARKNLKLAVEGSPVPIPYLSKADDSGMPEQRRFKEKEGKITEFRTISRFNEQLSTVIRSLYILGEAAKHHPLIIETTLSDYSHNFAGGDQDVPCTAMGLLEMMHVLDLIYDKRFYTLADQLRDTVRTSVSDYSELKDKFKYSVVENKVFWHHTEAAETSKRKMSYAKSERAHDPILRTKISLETPVVNNWQTVSKKRQEINRTLRGLNLYNSIKATVADFSEEKAVKRVVSDRLRRADLTVQKRDLERKEVERLRDIWRKFIDDQISEETTIGAREIELINNSTRLILSYFDKDDSLSQKAKTNIRSNESNNGLYYDINAAKLAEDPLFSWILALRNPYVRRAFGEAIEKDQSSAESFFLLLKVMNYEVLRKSIGKKELNFLFDPNYPQKIDSESLQHLYRNIEALAKKYVPDVAEITKNIVSLGDSKIEDLLNPDNLIKYRRKLESLTYKNVLKLFWKDKSRAFTQEDKQKVKLVAKSLLINLALGEAAYLLNLNFPKIHEFRDRKIEAGRAGDIARMEAMRAEWVKEQSLIDARVNRMNTAEARVAAEIRRKLAGVTSGIPFMSAEEITRNAAEMSKIPAEMGDRIPDRIRNEGDLLPSESERFGLKGFGRIYHLPESMRVGEGDPIGYFPWDINVQEFSYGDIDTSSIFFDKLKLFENTILIDSIDNKNSEDYDFRDNHLAYSMNGVNPEMYPPIGWRFVAVFQEGGKQPKIGPLGELYYAYDGLDNIPQKAVFVIEEVEKKYLDTKISLLQGIDTGGYYPYFPDQHSDRLVADLSKDPSLQKISESFSSEINELTSMQHNLSEEEYTKRYSDIGIKYATQYAQYTALNRYYALGFQIEKEGEMWNSLTSLADKPEEGYFCSVASFAFRDFMDSAGFLTGNQPGIELHNYQGYLWGGMGHMNNIVFLPDGRVLEADMTPYVDERTPESDLEWLKGRIVTQEDIRLAVEKADTELKASQSERTIEDEDAVRRMISENNRIREITEHRGYISDEKINQRLGEISSNIDLITSREISLRAQNSGNIETITEENPQFMLLRRMAANTQRVLSNPPTMLDIQAGKTSADEVYGEYLRLESILTDTHKLAELSQDKEITARLELIDYAVLSLLNDMEKVDGDLINEGKKNAEEMAEYERRYRDYYERTGRIPGEINEEDKTWDKIETQRDRNAWLSMTPISDMDFQWFDDMHLEELETDLQLLVNHMSIRNGDRNAAFIEETQLPSGIPSGDYSELAIATSEIGQLIRNRTDLYSQFDDKTKEDLAQLPSSLYKMSDIFSRTSQLSDVEQQLEAAKALGMVKRLNSAVENIRNPKTDELKEEQEERKRKILTSEQINDIIDTSSRLAVGASVLAFAYLGLRIYKSAKKDKENIETIKRSFSAKKNLTSVEKDIVLSTVGHVCHLVYDNKFHEKAAVILGLIEHYSPSRHDAAIRWLVNEGADILLGGDVKNSYFQLAELANGKARGISAQEIRSYFPEVVTQGLGRIDTHSQSGNGNKSDISKIEVPYEFETIYGISRLLLNNSLVNLHEKVLERLGVAKPSVHRGIPQKIDDFGSLLRQKYIEGAFPETSKPLVNTIYFVLRSGDEIEEKPVLAD